MCTLSGFHGDLVYTLVLPRFWWRLLFLFFLWYAARTQITGFWASPTGDLFEIRAGREGLVAMTASGFMGARPAEAYPVQVRGFRSVEILFPRGGSEAA